MIKVENVPELYGDHLEARVAFHAKHANEANLEEILLFVPMTRTQWFYTFTGAKKFNSHICYNCSLDSINTRCYADITSLAKTISNVDALPGISAYTDCN